MALGNLGVVLRKIADKYTVEIMLVNTGLGDLKIRCGAKYFRCSAK